MFDLILVSGIRVLLALLKAKYSIINDEMEYKNVKWSSC